MHRPALPLLCAFAIAATGGCGSALRSIVGGGSAPLSVEVRDEAGAPVAGALVRVRPAYAHVPGRSEPLALRPRGGETAVADDAGACRVTAPVDQPLELIIFAPDGRTGTLVAGHPSRLGETGWQPLLGPDGGSPGLEASLGAVAP